MKGAVGLAFGYLIVTAAVIMVLAQIVRAIA